MITVWTFRSSFWFSVVETERTVLKCDTGFLSLLITKLLNRFMLLATCDKMSWHDTSPCYFGGFGLSTCAATEECQRRVTGPLLGVWSHLCVNVWCCMPFTLWGIGWLANAVPSNYCHYELKAGKWCYLCSDYSVCVLLWVSEVESKNSLLQFKWNLVR